MWSCACWWCCIYFCRKFQLLVRTRSMWAAGASYTAFLPYLFQLPKNGSLESLGMWHQTTFLCHACFMCCTFLFSAHTHPFHALWPFCLASFSVPPAPFLSISVPLSLPIFPICLTPLYHKKSQRLKALCAPCSALWFPSFPHFPLSFSLPCVVSLAVPLKFCFSVFLHL